MIPYPLQIILHLWVILMEYFISLYCNSRAYLIQEVNNVGLRLLIFVLQTQYKLPINVIIELLHSTLTNTLHLKLLNLWITEMVVLLKNLFKKLIALLHQRDIQLFDRKHNLRIIILQNNWTALHIEYFISSWASYLVSKFFSLHLRHLCDEGGLIYIII